MSSIRKRPDGAWRARYRDHDGKEHSRHFARKIDAETWLKEVDAALLSGLYVDPRRARITVAQWCDEWLSGYTGRAGTMASARTHIAQIKLGFPGVRVVMLKPSMVKTWTAELSKTMAPGTVYATYRRLAQIMAAAHRDGLIPRSPCSRDTAPPRPPQRPYVATLEQVQQLHDTFPEHQRVAVLLAAFAGLRVAEIAGLRVGDVDLDEAVIYPRVQYGDKPLKSTAAETPIPIPTSFAEYLRAAMKRHPGATVVTDGDGGSSSPWALERAMRTARKKIPGLPAGFRVHDLRHTYASLLIASGLDIKTVQTRVRHASATTTLGVYGHMFPDADERTRGALEPLFSRADYLRTPAVLKAGQPGSDKAICV